MQTWSIYINVWIHNTFFIQKKHLLQRIVLLHVQWTLMHFCWDFDMTNFEGLEVNHILTCKKWNVKANFVKQIILKSLWFTFFSIGQLQNKFKYTYSKILAFHTKTSEKSLDSLKIDWGNLVKQRNVTFTINKHKKILPQKPSQQKRRVNQTHINHLQCPKLHQKNPLPSKHMLPTEKILDCYTNMFKQSLAKPEIYHTKIIHPTRGIIFPRRLLHSQPRNINPCGVKAFLDFLGLGYS